MPTRKHFTANEKAQIALEILKEEKTVNQLASEYGVHPNVLYRWKKQALKNYPSCSRMRTKVNVPGKLNTSVR